jgi:23S rRNA (guanosine2251-2'-O)-methyltransferase
MRGYRYRRSRAETLSRGRAGRRPGERAHPGAWPIGGRRPVLEALRSGRAKRVLVATEARTTEGLRALLREAERSSTPVERVDSTAVEALGLRDHQGVAALVVPPAELDEHAIATASFDPDALVVVLDGITDPQNFGACARSAEAAGASLLVARKRRAAPLTPAAVRASAGALLHLPTARVANIPRALQQLRDRGFFVAGLDHRADIDIHRASRPPRPLAMVVGAEDVGLSRLSRDACDLLVSIPMKGQTASLNASAALSVGLFAYAARSAP